MDIQNLINQLKFQEARKEIDNLKKQGQNVTSLEKKFNQAVNQQKKNIEEKFIIVIQNKLKEGDLIEVLKIQKQIHTIGLKSSKIETLIQEANVKLQEKILKEHQAQIDEFKIVINKHLQENNYNQLMQDTYTFIKANKWTFESHYDLQILKEVKRKIIDDKFRDNKNKLKNHTIITQFEFIKKLYLIDESYTFAQKLLYKYQKKLEKYDKLKKKILKREALINLKVIYNQKKYEQVIIKAKEFLQTQSQSHKSLRGDTFNKIIKKARHKIQTENYRLAFTKILKNHK